MMRRKLVETLFALLLILSNAKNSKTCKHRFQTCYSPPGQLTSCIEFFPLQPKSWEGAEGECKVKGGFLATHEDYEEWLWTKTELDEIAIEEPPKGCKGEDISKVVWWIGGRYDKEVEGWSWVDDTGRRGGGAIPNGVTRGKDLGWREWRGEWAVDHPQEGSDCLAIKFGPAPYNWYSLHCGYLLPFICKWKQKKRNDVCHLPVIFGSCDEELVRYYYDSQKGSCQPFTYKGCNGGPNMFDSAAACSAACPSKAREYCSISAKDGGPNLLVDGDKIYPLFPRIRPPGDTASVSCAAGFRLYFRSLESYVDSDTPRILTCHDSLAWSEPLPVCLPVCPVEKGFVDSLEVFATFWKRFWHHRSDLHLKDEVLNSCFSFVDDQKATFPAAAAVCRHRGAKLAAARRLIKLEMLNHLAGEAFWRGRLRYTHNHDSLDEFDASKNDYESWWVNGLEQDLQWGMRGMTIGPHHFYSPMVMVNKPLKEKHFYICERPVPFPTDDDVKGLGAIFDKVVMKRFGGDSAGGGGGGAESIGGEMLKEAKRVVAAYDRKRKTEEDWNDEEAKLKSLRSIIRASTLRCCAVIRPAVAAVAKWRRLALPTLVAKKAIDDAKKRWESWQCDDELSCYDILKKSQDEIEEDEKMRGGGGGGGDKDPAVLADRIDCSITSHAVSSTPPICTSAQIFSASTDVTPLIQTYLKLYQKPDDGKYSSLEPGKLGAAYEKAKGMKFVRDKPLGPLVEAISFSRDHIARLIRQGFIDRKSFEELEEFALVEAAKEEDRTMREIQAENSKKKPNVNRLLVLASEYKDVSPYGGALQEWLVELVERNKTTGDKTKNVKNYENFASSCPVDFLTNAKLSWSAQCQSYFQSNRDQKPQPDVKDAKGVAKEFARRGGVCAVDSASCSSKGLSSQNVKHDLDVRLSLKLLLDFGLDTENEEMLKRIVESPYLKAAVSLGLDEDDAVVAAEEKVEFKELKNSAPLDPPSLNAKVFNPDNCESYFNDLPLGGDVTKALVCLQGALAGIIGSQDQVKKWMTPDKDSWPIRLANEIETSRKKLLAASKGGDLENKLKVLKEVEDMGFPGYGENKDNEVGHDVAGLLFLVLAGSCPSKELREIRNEMVDADVHNKGVEDRDVKEWRKELDAAGRPALDGEEMIVGCEEDKIYEPVNTEVRCVAGDFKWNPSAECVRKKCPKPTLADGVVFVVFEEKNLWTRDDDTDATKGVLVVKATDELKRPKTGERDPAFPSSRKFVCGIDKTWSPAITGPIESYRPNCPEIDTFSYKTDRQNVKKHPYQNLVVNYFKAPGQEDKQKSRLSGSFAKPDCQSVGDSQTITDPVELSCHPDDGWTLDQTTQWNGIIKCSFKGFCLLPAKKYSDDEMDCTLNDDDCDETYDMNWGKTFLDPGTYTSDMGCEHGGFSTTLHDYSKFYLDGFELHHVCSAKDKEGRIGLWVAMDTHKEKIMPMPTLETTLSGISSSKFFCEEICPDGFKVVKELMLINTGVETGEACCANDGLDNFFGCHKELNRVMTYDEAVEECSKIGAELPKEENIIQMCHKRSLQGICHPQLIKNPEGKLTGGHWLKTNGRPRKFAGKDPSQTYTCEVTDADVPKYIQESNDDTDKQNVLCVRKFSREGVSQFWREVRRLSDKCAAEGFWVKGEKWRKCPYEGSINCCLTFDQWSVTKCHKDICENPIKVYGPCRGSG